MTEKNTSIYHLSAPYKRTLGTLLFFCLLGASLVTANISLGSSGGPLYHNGSKIMSMPGIPAPSDDFREKDKFGIDMLYPTKDGGQEWYINMANPMSDGRFNPQDKITKNPDGSWKLTSNKVRMYVQASPTFNSNLITSISGQSKVAARGFMSSSQDWRDVEITGYVKLNSFTHNDNFVWFSRGGKHTESDHCQGSSYKGNLFYSGETQFSKEQWHVSYAKSPTTFAASPLKGKWIGFKFIMYNFEQQNGKTAVKLENWIDTDGGGKNWEKVYEGADAGKWGRTGTNCGVRPDQIISWGGPIAAYRWDFAPDVDFKDLSVREISGTNGITDGITFFTGTRKSSGVQDFGIDGNPPVKNTFSNENFSSITLSSKRSFADYSGHIANPSYAQLENNSNARSETETFDQRTIVEGDKVYVLWVSGDEDDTDVYLKISSDRGLTFGEPINLSNNPASLSYHPQMTIEGSNIYIVWEDDDGNSGNTDIFYIKSSDGGKTFAEKKNISNDLAGSGNPQILAYQGNVYVVWSGTSQDDTDISIAESTDGGNTFGKAKNLSNNPELSFNPQISLNGTYLDVVWKEKAEDGKLSTNKKILFLPQFGQENQSSLNDPRIISGPFANFTNATDSNSRQSNHLFNNSSFLLNSTASKYSNGTNLYLIERNYSSTISAGNSSLPMAESKRLLLLAEKSLKDHILSSSQATQTNTNLTSNSSLESAPVELHAPQTPSAILADNKTCSCRDNLKVYDKNADRPRSIQNNKNTTVSNAMTIETIEAKTEQANKYLNNSSSNSFDVLSPSLIEQSKQNQIQSKSHADQIESPNNLYTNNLKQDKITKSTETIVTKQHKKQEQLITKKDPLSSNPVESKINDASVRKDGQHHVADRKNNPIIVNSNDKGNEKNNEKEINLRSIENEQKQLQNQKLKDKTKVQALLSKANKALGKIHELMKEAKITNQKLDETKQDLKRVGNSQNEIDGQLALKIHRLEHQAKTMNQKASNAEQKYEELHLDAIVALDDFNKKYR